MTIEFDQPFLRALEEQRNAPSAPRQARSLPGLRIEQPGERILDLGCGSGSFCRALVPLTAPGGKVIGVDSAPEAVDLAARLSSHTEPDRLACLCADGHHLPFMDGSYDAAICISVLAFCERPNLVLAELRRLLRPGGRLLIANSDEDTRIINSRDQELGRRIMRGIADRARDPWIGRRLVYLLIANGFRLRQEAVITDVERVYTPGASGYTLAHAFRKHLLQTGVSAQDYEHWLADLEACGREGSYSYGVMTFVGLAER